MNDDDDDDDDDNDDLFVHAATYWSSVECLRVCNGRCNVGCSDGSTRHNSDADDCHVLLSQEVRTITHLLSDRPHHGSYPSVCPSVCQYGLLTRNQKDVEQQKLV